MSSGAPTTPANLDMAAGDPAPPSGLYGFGLRREARSPADEESLARSAPDLPGESSTPRPAREENVAAADLTSLDIDALLAAQCELRSRASGYAGSTAIMGETDMEALYRALGDDDSQGGSYLPPWAKDPPPRNTGRGYRIDDVYGGECGGDEFGAAYDDESAYGAPESDDRSEETYRAVRRTERTCANVEDAAANLRDDVAEVKEDIKALQDQVSDTEEGLRAQTAALTEEVRELKYSIDTLLAQFALLSRRPEAGSPLAPVRPPVARARGHAKILSQDLAARGPAEHGAVGPAPLGSEGPSWESASGIYRDTGERS